jgi:hypothetical protein
MFMDRLSNGAGKNFSLLIIYTFFFTLLGHFTATADAYDQFLRSLHRKNNIHVYSKDEQITFNFEYGNKKSYSLSRQLFKNVRPLDSDSDSFVLPHASPRPLLFLLDYSLTGSFSIEDLNLKDFDFKDVLSSIFYVYKIAPDWFLEWNEEQQQKMMDAYYELFKELLNKKTTTLRDISAAKTVCNIGRDNWENLYDKLDQVRREISEKERLEKREQQLRSQSDQAAIRLLERLQYRTIRRGLASRSKKGMNSYLIVSSPRDKDCLVYQRAVARHNRKSDRAFNLKTDLIEEVRYQKYASSSEKASIVGYEGLITKYRLWAVPRAQ